MRVFVNTFGSFCVFMLGFLLFGLFIQFYDGVLRTVVQVQGLVQDLQGYCLR